MRRFFYAGIRFRAIIFGFVVGTAFGMFVLVLGFVFTLKLIGIDTSWISDPDQPSNILYDFTVGLMFFPGVCLAYWSYRRSEKEANYYDNKWFNK